MIIFVIQFNSSELNAGISYFIFGFWWCGYANVATGYSIREPALPYLRFIAAAAQTEDAFSCATTGIPSYS